MQDFILNPEETTDAEQTSSETTSEATVNDNTADTDLTAEVTDTPEVSATDATPQPQAQEVQETPAAPQAPEQTAAGVAAPPEPAAAAEVAAPPEPAEQFTAPSFEEPVFTPQNATYQKKSIGKKVLSFVLAAVLLLVIATGTTYALFPNQVKRTIMGNENYFVYVESKSMKNDTDSVVDMLSTMLNPAAFAEDFGVNGKYSFFIDSEALGLSELEILINKINKCQLEVIANSKKGVGANNVLKLLYDNDTVFTIEMYQNDDKTIIRYPELSDKYLILPDIRGLYSSYPTNFPTLYYSALSGNLEFDEAKLKKSLRGLIDTFVNNLGEVEITPDSYTIDGITKKVDVMTVQLDKKGYANLIAKVLEQVKQDDYIKEFICTNFKNIFNYEFIDEDYIERVIDQGIDNINRFADYEDEDFVFKYQSFVDSKGNIVGRSIHGADRYSSVTFEYFDFTDKADSATVFSVLSDNEEIFSVKSKSTISKGKHTGNLVVEKEGQKLFTAKYKDFLLKDGDLTGTIEIVDIKDFPYTFKIEATKDTIEFSLHGDNKKVASITATAKAVKPQDFRMPELNSSNSVNFEDPFEIMEWAESLDLETFGYEVLEKLDFTEEEIQELLYLFFYYAFPVDEFDYDDYYYDFDFDDFDFDDFYLDDYDFENLYNTVPFITVKNIG